MSIYTNLNIASQALKLNQAAMTVVTNNISNMDTEGYSKQRADFATDGQQTIYGIEQSYQISSGCQIGQIVRYSNEALNNSYRDQNADMNYYDEMLTMAREIETSLNELSSSGLGNAISEFFTAADALSADPTSSTARTNFVNKAEVLSTQFNSISNTINDARTGIVGSIDEPGSIYTSAAYITAEELNVKLEQLGDLNEVIIRTTSQGVVPNNLLDQKDKLLDEISMYLPIDTQTLDNGTTNLSINGVELVKGMTVNQLNVIQSADPDNPATVRLLDPDNNVISDNINEQITSGKMAAYLKMGGNEAGELTYQGVLNDINSLANAIATSINDIQTYTSATTQALALDYDVNGDMVLSDYAADGGLPPIFEASDGGTISALNLSVTSDIQQDYWKIATARADTTAADYDIYSVGNNDNAKLLSEVQNSSTIVTIDNMTPQNFLTSIVTEIGTDVEKLEFNSESASAVFTSTETERQNETGVNIDEELIDLMKYQRAYEASARIFSTMSDMMSVLVNLGR